MADTIAAISTPIGEGGIGIVRVSGSRAQEIMRRILKPCPETIRPRHAYYGTACDANGTMIDEVLCLYMKAPHSYTCEDVVEFQAHGGTLSLQRILRAVLKAGARLAEPGEFTRLAFMNGTITMRCSLMKRRRPQKSADFTDAARGIRDTRSKSRVKAERSKTDRQEVKTVKNNAYFCSYLKRKELIIID